MNSIHKKLLALDIAPVLKQGENNFSRYKYVQESDVLEAIKQPLKDAGLAIYGETVEASCDVKFSESNYYTVANVEYILTITDAESYIQVSSFGFAMDKNGDKALYKAITGASKYALLKAFNLGSGEDPENDSAEFQNEKNHMPKVKAKPAQAPPQKNQEPMNDPEREKAIAYFKGVVAQYGLTAFDLNHIIGTSSMVGVPAGQIIDYAETIVVYHQQKELERQSLKEIANGA